MAISLSVTPTGLSGLAEVSPVVFELLTAETSTAVSTVLDGAPDTVVLSDTGQLLSAISTFQNNLEILQTSAADTSPAAALATAQSLVETVNRLQASVGKLQAVVEPLAANSPVALLNELAAAATAASLPSVGIALPAVTTLNATPTANATATSSVLRIDLSALNAALVAAPAGTQDVLSKAVQALIDLADEFEAQLADAAATAAAQARGTQATGGTVAPTPTTAAAAAALAVATPGPTATALPENIVAAVGSPLPATSEAVTTEEIDTNGSASAATLALQRLLADPARNARNNLFDPAYAWLTGAFHVSDFALPGQTINPNAGLPDFPPPILPVAPADGIAYYKEAAEDTRSRVVKQVNHLA